MAVALYLASNETNMADDMISLVMGVIVAMKQMREDVSYNTSCRELAAHCQDLAYPVQRINEYRTALLHTNKSALQNALSLLTECRNFCDKHNGRGFLKMIVQSRKDAHKITQLHRRLDSAAFAFDTQVSLLAYNLFFISHTDRFADRFLQVVQDPSR